MDPDVPEELVPFPAGTMLPAHVWSLRGAEVWEWTGAAWVRAEPQPERRVKLLAGTVCDRRGHCDLTMVTDVHAVCGDCGATTFSDSRP